MNRNNLVKFTFIEVLFTFLVSFLYSFSLKISNINVISIIISLILSLIFEYISLRLFIFKKFEDNLISIFKFLVIGFFGYFLRRGMAWILYYLLLVNVIYAKLIVIIPILFFDYVTKNYIFNNEYSIKNWKNDYKKILDVWDRFINLKYINYFFKFLPKNLYLFIFFIGSIYFGIRFFNENDNIVLYKQSVADNTIGTFINDTYTVDFEDVDVNSDVNQICIIFGTYARSNDSNLDFKLYNSNNNVIFNKKINTNILYDGNKYCLNVPTIKSNEINKYHLDIISTNADKDNNVTIFSDKKTGKPSIILGKFHSFLSFKYVIMFFYIMLFLIFNYFINNKKHIKPENILFIIFIYMLSVLFINPPLQAPDEPVHLYNVINLSQNGFNSDKLIDINVPQNFYCINYSSVQGLNRVVDLNDISNCIKEDKNLKVNNYFGTNSLVGISFLGYSSQAIFVKIIDYFSNSPLLIFNAARIGNLIVAFVFLYFAVKITPKYKSLFIIIVSLPMFIQQISSVSYDAILNSISLLYCAFVLRKIFDKSNITFKDIIIPSFCILILFTVKQVYSFLVVMLLFIPKERFKGSLKKFLYFVVISLVAFLGYYLISKVFFAVAGDGGVNKQMQYLLANPTKLFPITFNTIKRNTWFYLSGIVGYFDWFEFTISNFTIFVYLFVFIYICLSENSIFERKFSLKWISLLIAVLLSVIAIFASMYFFWSSYKLNYVDGVQGRYFIALLFPIGLLIMPKKKKFNFSYQFIYSFCNIVLIQYILYLIIYFY